MCTHLKASWLNRYLLHRSLSSRRHSLVFALAALTLPAVAFDAGTPMRTRTVVARNMLAGQAAEKRAAGDDTRAAERTFFAQATETAQRQKRLAEVGVSQAQSSAVRSHALQLAGDYRQLTQDLEAVIQRKGAMPGAPVGGTSETFPQLLQRSGADFDRAFVEVAGELSERVLALFEQAASEAKDEEVRAFASAQLPLLRAHRNRAVALKRDLE